MRSSRMVTMTLGVILLGLVFSATFSAASSSVRDEPAFRPDQETLRSVSRTFVILLNIANNPNFSSGGYQVTPDEGNNYNLRSFNVPLDLVLDAFGRDRAFYLRGRASYTRVTQQVDLEPLYGFPKPKNTAFNVGGFSVGAGLTIRFNPWLALLPSISVAGAYIDNETKYNGDFENDVVGPLLNETAFNWHSAGLGTVIGMLLRFEDNSGAIGLEGDLEYLDISMNYFDSSNNLYEFVVESQMLAARGRAKLPLSLSLLRMPVLLNLESSFVHFLSEDLDFNNLVELESTLELNVEYYVGFMESIRLGPRFTIGENIQGFQFAVGFKL